MKLNKSNSKCRTFKINKTQEEVKDVKNTLRPCLRHSQNFLKSSKLVTRLIKKTNLNKQDKVYEIGGGKGIITRQLADYCNNVVVIEKDLSLYRKLCQKFFYTRNIEIIHGDFLKMKLPEKGDYKIFSNIPFIITAEIIKKITTSKNPATDTHLIIQEEAAKKYTGSPYGKERLISLSIKPWFDLQIIYHFKQSDFQPSPSVDAVLLQIAKRSSPLVTKEQAKKYLDFIAYGFSRVRPDCNTVKKVYKDVITDKQFRRLSNSLHFVLAAQPTDLTFRQWLGLFEFFLSRVPVEKQILVVNYSKKLELQQKKLSKVHRSRK